jgi:hypothetical protein
MDASSADIARAAAQHLTSLDPTLPALVEARIQSNTDEEQPPQYEITLALAIAISSFVVSVASLAWKVYWDLRSAGHEPEREVVSRQIRLEVPLPPRVTENLRDQVISAVVDEIYRR